jgi:thymidylate synthase
MSTTLNVSVSLSGRFDRVYDELLDVLLHRGQVVSPRTQPTREIRGVQLQIRDYGYNILYHEQRNLNYKFMGAEWLWIATGLDDVATIAHFNKKYLQFTDDGVILFGAYGPPWVAQKSYVLRKLRKDPESRQAVITLWKPNPPDSKDIPCTLSMHYMLREGYLDVVVNMRSSDIYLGIPYDVFTFSQLANEIAFELNVKRGDLIMQIGSSHVYERDIANVRSLMFGEFKVLKSPAIRSVMPRERISLVIRRPDHFPPAVTIAKDDLWGLYELVLTSSRDLALPILIDLEQDTNNRILSQP